MTDSRSTTTDQTDEDIDCFINAAKHAGFTVKRSRDTWSMWRTGGGLTFDNVTNITELGETIRNVLKAERGE